MNRIQTLFNILFILSIVLLNFKNAYPVGLGVYINGTSGRHSVEYGDYYAFDGPIGLGRDKEDTGTVAGYGGGIMIDTGPDSDRLLNYRLITGYERMHIFIPNKVDLHRFNLNNVWGFKLYRDDSIRLWLGPQLGIHYFSGEDRGVTDEIIFFYALPPTYLYPARYKRRYRLFGINTGIAIGINFSFSKFILSVEAGGRTFLTVSKNEVNNIPPSGYIGGFEGYIIIGFLGNIK